MRRRSRCRGYTCIELPITLGVIGSLIIVLTGVVVREVEKLYTRQLLRVAPDPKTYRSH